MSASPTTFEQRLRRYCTHWTSKRSLPPSIRWLEAFANKISYNIWRPSDDAAQYVEHRPISHTRSYFEELIPDYEPHKRGATETEVDAAMESEIQHRIYKAIYWGNLFDHIFPIETRYYSLSTDRFAKMTIIVVSAILLYLAVTIVPSGLIKRAELQNAATELSGSKLINYLSEVDASLKFKDATTVRINPISDPIYSIENVADLRFRVHGAVMGQPNDFKDWVSAPGWRGATSDARREAVSDKIFVEILLLNNSQSYAFLSSNRLIVTPWSNWAEVISQIFILVSALITVSWFLSKKAHFQNAISKIEKSKRIPALQLLEETLMPQFYLRKKYHYLTSLAISGVVTFFHFFMMNTISHDATTDISIILGITPYDYRVGNAAPWVVSIYWLAQYFLVFFFTLTAWELGALNSCMRQWQGKLVKAKILEGPSFRSVFVEIQKSQKMVLTFMAMLAAALFVLSFYKYKSIDVIGPISFAGLKDAPIATLFNWEVAYIVYTFSPSALFMLIMVFASRPCFDVDIAAKIYVDRRLPDLDEILAAAKDGWAQLAMAKAWLDNAKAPESAPRPNNDLKQEGEE